MNNTYKQMIQKVYSELQSMLGWQHVGMHKSKVEVMVHGEEIKYDLITGVEDITQAEGIFSSEDHEYFLPHTMDYLHTLSDLYMEGIGA